ncbi:MAG: DUF4270 family protein [Chitinophagaceae bacterium]|nr:DUF4270 family protein [Chitinophagaceae bacterium]
MLYIFPAGLLLLSCTRQDVQFGDNPENSYTNIVFTDTVSVALSTVILDSFATSNASSFLVGRYSDPYLGVISAKSFCQMTVPLSVPAIPSSALFDSLTFIFKPSDYYYYGDTMRQQTFYINELSQTITHTYSSSLYNTSDIPVKAIPLGSQTLHIRPVLDDSVSIRLSDVKGQELFTKLRNLSTDVTTQEEFLNYFKGISISTGLNDTTAVYGVNGAAGAMIMRVHYHTTIPFPEKQYIDFTSLSNEYSFNQVKADRAGTGIVQGGNNGITEIIASQTNQRSFLQPGTGVYLKMIFPSLRSLVTTDKIVKLVKAELVVRPAYLSFDKNKYKLPSSLYLVQTDASNTAGASVYDSTGSAVLNASPVTDDLYGENNYYRFNITTYINQLLTTSGSEDNGFFLMHDSPVSSMNVNRLVLNNSLHGSQSSKLLLYMIVINK